MSRPFSRAWVAVSMVIFIAAQLILGVGVSKALQGGMVTMNARYAIEAALNLGAYFLGGVVVGIVSPGVRISEPAVGAFLSVVLMSLVTFFTPINVFQFSVARIIIGGGIALVLATSGATLGEKIMGNKVDT